MTGFGKASKEFVNKTVNVEIRSLNSKNLDLNLRWNYFTNEAFALLGANLVASLAVEYQTFV